MIRRLFQNKIFDNTLYTLSGKMAAMLLYMAFDIACARLLTPETYAEWVFFLRNPYNDVLHWMVWN